MEIPQCNRICSQPPTQKALLHPGHLELSHLAASLMITVEKTHTFRKLSLLVWPDPHELLGLLYSSPVPLTSMDRQSHPCALIQRVRVRVWWRQGGWQIGSVYNTVHVPQLGLLWIILTEWDLPSLEVHYQMLPFVAPPMLSAVAQEGILLPHGNEAYSSLY